MFWEPRFRSPFCSPFRLWGLAYKRQFSFGATAQAFLNAFIARSTRSFSKCPQLLGNRHLRQGKVTFTEIRCRNGNLHLYLVRCWEHLYEPYMSVFKDERGDCSFWCGGFPTAALPADWGLQTPCTLDINDILVSHLIQCYERYFLELPIFGTHSLTQHKYSNIS